jgi:hypothetical protein
MPGFAAGKCILIVGGIFRDPLGATGSDCLEILWAMSKPSISETLWKRSVFEHRESRGPVHNTENVFKSKVGPSVRLSLSL